MITFAWYLLKVIICSGILYGYYMLALRDKIFHKYNRFYLLAAIVLSITAPLIKINILQKADEPKTQAVQLLQAISSGDEIIFDYAKDKSTFHLDANNIAGLIYSFVASLLLIILIQTLIRIFKLKKKYNATVVEGINFISSNAKGTPFSFFNNIFWNEKIDINSPTGKQIFKHEVAHVQERHSYDKVFINIVLILFWCNPLFWLMRKELNIIHEFIADQKALEDSDTAAFAAMILQATYPQQQFTITNNFFYSPLKRRLAMLTKNKNPKINYVSRLVVLPLAAVVFFAFTLKLKTINPAFTYSGRTINVIIDAGHGGDDKGGMSNNIYEKYLTLSIAKKIKELNKDEKINIILSREEDKTMSVQERILLANANKADLFISVHIDAEVNKNSHSGLTLFIPPNDNLYLDQSKLLGADIIESFKSNYLLPVPAEYKQRDKGIYILKANQYPAVLIEGGYLTTQKDLDYLTKPANQEIIARNILNGIEKYVQKNKTDLKAFESRDTPPPTVLPGKVVVINKTDTIIFRSNDTSFNSNNKAGTSDIIFLKDVNTSKSPIYLVNGKEISKDEMNQLLPNSIKSVSVLKGESATNKYGNKAKDGAIEITLKDNTSNDTIPKGHRIYINVHESSSAYLQSEEIKSALVILNGKEMGNLGISYANKFKYVDSIKIINNNNAVKIYGDKGRNGVIILSAKNTELDDNKHSVFNVDPNAKKIFTKVEVEPSFPGGQTAWIKFITDTIRAHISEIINEGKAGTCHVRFIVGTEGKVSDVEAMDLRGTKLAEVCINAIKTGPNWIPAKQNEHVVAAYRIQPVTFTMQKDK